MRHTSIRMSHRRLETLALLVAGLSILTCCTSGDGPPTQIIRIGVTATANEPAPALSSGIVGRLHDAVNAGKVQLSVYQAGDGATSELKTEDFSVYRDATELEQDAGTRDQGFRQKLETLQQTLGTVANGSGQLDLFTLLADMARPPGPATLVVVSSGLQTVGQLDTTASGLDIDVTKTLAALPQNALPDLGGKTVLFSGLGQVAGAQQPLPEVVRQTLTQLWLGVCRKFHATSCEVDAEPLPGEAPTATTGVQTMPVSAPGPVIVPNKRPTDPIPLPRSALFQPESAELIPGADQLLGQLASYFGPRTTATVVGHTATYGQHDSAVTLSQKRAQKVVDVLTDEFGVGRDAFTEVNGVGFDHQLVPDIDSAGRLIPDAAEHNRVVVVTLTNPVSGDSHA